MIFRGAMISFSDCVGSGVAPFVELMSGGHRGPR